VRTGERIDLLTMLGEAELEPEGARMERAFPVLHDDQRQAVVVYAPARVSFRGVPLNPGAVLSFGYAAAVPRGTSAQVALSVETVVAGTARTVFTAELDVREVGVDEWHEAEVPLPAPQGPGERVDLVLRAECAKPECAVVAWAWPTIASDGAAGTEARDTVVAEAHRVDLLARFGEATLLAAPDGRRPSRMKVDLANDLTRRPVILVPPDGGLRYRTDLAPDDFLRVRFHVAPNPREAPQPLAGTVRLEIRVRPVSASGDEDAPWQEAGAIELDAARMPAWGRSARATFDLRIVAAGPAELELRAKGRGVQGTLWTGFSELTIVGRSTVPRRAAADGGKNVLVLLVDALRADHLGAYGYARDTSPNLDRAAARGIVFDRAETAAPWTLPAVVSLLTGTLATTHGVVYATDSMLPADRRTVGDIFRENGYSTAAFVGNPLIGEQHGFRVGFEDFEECLFMDAGRINERLLTWVRAHKAERFFAYVHFMEPHAPYAAPDPYYSYFDPEYAGRIVRNSWNGQLVHGGWDAAVDDPTAAAMGSALARGVPVVLRETLGEEAVQDDAAGVVYAGPPLVHRMVDLYDGEIRAWDARFGELLAGLAAEGLDDETVIVVLADHGEEFVEHGRFGHGFDFFEPAMRIPLLVLDPAEPRPRRIGALVSIADVVPMLLERLGLTAADSFDGWPLSRIEGPEAAGRVLLAHTAYYVPDGRGQRRARTPAFCLRREDLKVVHVPRDEAWLGWRPESDPAESRQLDAEDPAVQAVRGTMLEIRRRLEAITGPDAQPGDGQDDRILRALGYIR
jgi:arylsulfatase A-like enzyme